MKSPLQKVLELLQNMTDDELIETVNKIEINEANESGLADIFIVAEPIK